MTALTQVRQLTGRRIALLETREAKRFGQMFREQGATAVGCRTVAIVDVADPAPVLACSGDLSPSRATISYC